MRVNHASIHAGLVQEFGEAHFEAKLKDFTDLGAKPFSVVAFHNRFFDQARRSFVIGAYYPALVGTCALGERILNHLVLSLRHDFRATAEYRKVYRKQSFDNWEVAINALAAWEILTPGAKEALCELMDKRNNSVHFRPEVDSDARGPALEALSSMGRIIECQFGAHGQLPWLLHGVPGEVYIKHEWEHRPFIARIYRRSCVLVGPAHQVVSSAPLWQFADTNHYDDRDVTDEEFVELRKAAGGAI